MYDPEDIRRKQNTSVPPWELDTSSRLRDWFSAPGVEGEENTAYRKKDEAREEAQRRKEAHDRRWAQTRAQRQARMDAQRAAQAAWQQGQGSAGDLRGKRYTYGRMGRNLSARSGSAVVGVVIIVLLALVVSTVMNQAVSGGSAAVTPEEPVYDEWYGGEWYDGGEDDGEQWQEPEPQPETQATQEEPDQELERAELGEALTLPVESAQGRTPLTYQELYAKCLPSTVSITVVTDEGLGTGTGIVMTQDGYILTCAHVVEDGRTCQVTTDTDETYDALLVGADAQTDLAVLKIDAQGLTPAEFGDSDELTVGDEALAIGDPLGTELRGTLTNGIISAINRNVTVNSYSMTLIQTTAALNSGNSGGPLINIYGQVVGVNNMKMNSSQVTVEGLGFAVPTSVVREIVPILSTQGKVSRPVLGITCYGIDELTAEQNGEPVTGLRVASVTEGSDAYNQGLQVGDYITAVNGVHVESVEEVKVLIEDLEIGDTVDLDIFRVDEVMEQTEEFTLTIALVDQSEIY